MKKIILFIILAASIFGFTPKKSFDIKGFWQVCGEPKSCEEDDLSVYIVFDDSSILTFMGFGDGLPPNQIGREPKYIIKESIIYVADSIPYAMKINIINDKRINLVRVDSPLEDTLFLFKVSPK